MMKLGNSIIRTTIMIIIGSILLLACQPVTESPTLVTETATPSKTPPTPNSTPTPTMTQYSTETPVVPNIFENSTLQPSLEQPTATLPIHDSTPIRFTFPTPMQPPVSLWRPPLYEVPWCPGPYDHFYFNRPIAANEVNWPLANYRYGGTFTGTDIVHTGVDIDAPRGTPVLAAGSGTVTFAGNGLFFGRYDPTDPYGIAVVIKHDFGYQGNPLYTVYAHMDRVDVVVGQQVKSGTQLGIVGLTGNTTGPHLHFEVRIGKNTFFVTRNPELWLSPPQGWGVLVGRLMNDRNGLLEKLDINVISKTSDQTWTVRTYGPMIINSDDYYHENVVLSDLPAGDYTVEFSLTGQTYSQDITINPGATTFFIFSTKNGFSLPVPTPASPDSWLRP